MIESIHAAFGFNLSSFKHDWDVDEVHIHMYGSARIPTKS